MTKQTNKVMHKGTEVVVKVDLTGYTTTSAKIRALSAAGHSRMEISKILNIKYQWVRNVLITPIKTK